MYVYGKCICRMYYEICVYCCVICVLWYFIVIWLNWCMENKYFVELQLLVCISVTSFICWQMKSDCLNSGCCFQCPPPLIWMNLHGEKIILKRLLQSNLSKFYLSTEWLVSYSCSGPSPVQHTIKTFLYISPVGAFCCNSRVISWFLMNNVLACH